jgi:hypothetical protein
MRILLAALLALATSAAQAGYWQDNSGKWWKLIDPPARYLYAPYTGETEVIYLAGGEVGRICADFVGHAAGEFGCALVQPDYCLIYVRDDVPVAFKMALVRHELAHCGPNGWPADHPEE